MIRSVDQLDIAERRVFVRVDFNVPFTADQKIADKTRIEAALPTLKYLVDQGSRLIIASHLGRPQGKVDRRYSLLPVAECLAELLSDPVIFPEHCVGDGVQRLAMELKPGRIMLLENLRFDPGEEANESHFAEQLAAFADVYVNEAFGTLHRAHASTAGMVRHFTEKGAGFLVQQELKVLSQLTENPARPFWAIIGGAKVSDKIGLIERLVNKVDGLILGGGLAFTFLKARGYEVGRSLLEEEKLFVAKRILRKAQAKGVQILLPLDHRVAAELSAEAKVSITDSAAVPPQQMGLDIGPKTVQACIEALQEARTLFWNGPLGCFELPAFAEGTRQVAQAVAKSQAVSIIGGGDSLAALKSLELAGQVTHISTGGGASLAFLEGRDLPGLKALEERPS